MFRTRWERRALNELAALWAKGDSAERQAITAASHTIEQRLIRNAVNEGESRSGGRRIAFAPPLAVTFRIEADGHTVSILHVRVFRKRKP
jgi:polyribonucleotide nucleotidyltransferase